MDTWKKGHVKKECIDEWKKVRNSLSNQNILLSSHDSSGIADTRASKARQA